MSFTPLFLLIAIRGNDVVEDEWTWLVCSLMMVIPASFLTWRMVLVWRSDANDEIVVGEIEDSRSHVLGYLFATMLPFYRSSIDQWRDLIAPRGGTELYPVTFLVPPVALRELAALGTWLPYLYDHST